MPRRGLFITFEGLDGTGKSTQLELLARCLRDQGLEVVTTREPGGTGLGEQVRSLVLASRTCGLTARAELALMFASRAQHIEEIIAPAMAAGKIVICDRFTDSSEAYQGSARGLGRGPVAALHAALCGGLLPDATILLMFADAARSLDRAQQRNREATIDESRFESEGEAFQRLVAQGYRSIAEREPDRMRVIDAAGSIVEVHAAIVAALAPLLDSRKMR